MANNSIELALSVLEAEKANLNAGQLKRLAELTNTGEDVRSDVTEALETTEKRELTPEEQTELLSTLEARSAKEPDHYRRLGGVDFAEVKKALEANPALMYSLAQMENTGGLPDVIAIEDDAFVFGDCSVESPNRRNLNYDEAAKMARELGVDMMPEDAYRKIQETGEFDRKTWSWLATPDDIREAGYALRGGRYGGGVGVSRYGARGHNSGGGWRGVLRVPKA